MGLICIHIRGEIHHIQSKNPWRKSKRITWNFCHGPTTEKNPSRAQVLKLSHMSARGSRHKVDDHYCWRSLGGLWKVDAKKVDCSGWSNSTTSNAERLGFSVMPNIDLSTLSIFWTLTFCDSWPFPIAEFDQTSVDLPWLTYRIKPVCHSIHLQCCSTVWHFRKLPSSWMFLI